MLPTFTNLELTGLSLKKAKFSCPPVQKVIEAWEKAGPASPNLTIDTIAWRVEPTETLFNSPSLQGIGLYHVTLGMGRQQPLICCTYSDADHNHFFQIERHLLDSALKLKFNTCRPAHKPTEEIVLQKVVGSLTFYMLNSPSYKGLYFADGLEIVCDQEG